MRSVTKYFGKVYQEPWLKSNGNSTCASGTSTLSWPCARVLSHGDQAVHVSILVRPCRVQYRQAPFFTEAILPSLVPGPDGPGLGTTTKLAPGL